MRCLFLWFALALLAGCGGDHASIAGSDAASPRLTLNARSITIPLGADTALSVAAYAGGSVVAAPAVTWTSSVPTVARVSAAGVVSSVARGKATITATWRDAVTTADVVVRGSDLRIVTPTDAQNMVPGSSRRVTAVLSDEDGKWVTTGYNVSWSSADTTVATVEGLQPPNSYLGTVTAVGPGATTITAVVGGLRASLEVTVLPALPYGTGGLDVVDAHMVEYRYEGDDHWYYAPIVQVTAGESAVDVLELQIVFPGGRGNGAFCGAIRIQPGETLDLNQELYGDYQISVDADHWRAPQDSIFTGALEYHRGDGTMVTQNLNLPVVSGTLPTTYTGGYGLWRGCPPEAP